MKWLSIRWLRFKKAKPFIIQNKYCLSDSNCLKINVTLRHRIGRKKNSWTRLELSKSNDAMLSVSQKKEKIIIAITESTNHFGELLTIY